MAVLDTNQEFDQDIHRDIDSFLLILSWETLESTATTVFTVPDAKVELAKENAAEQQE